MSLVAHYVQYYGDECAWMAAQHGAWSTLAALAKQRGCGVLTTYHSGDHYDERTALHVLARLDDAGDVLAGVAAVLPYTDADAWFMHRRYDTTLYTNHNPLQYLIESGHAQALRRVLAHIGHHMVDTPCHQRYTLLYTAVARYTESRKPWCKLRDRLLACVSVLIDAGADPHHVDGDGHMSIMQVLRRPVLHAGDDGYTETGWTMQDRQRLADVMGVDV